MKRRLIAFTLAVAIAGLMSVDRRALADDNAYYAVAAPTPGLWTVPQGIGRLVTIRCENAIPTTGTVIISRVNPTGTLTNTLATLTNVAGRVSYTPSAGSTTYTYEVEATDGTNVTVAVTHVQTETDPEWFLSGDILLRQGTATNGTVLLILSGR
jgi:hypothetical protein